ncbi:MAG: hypothetical protein RLY86_3455 [Pseudomonadota bacterium]|jgi:basic membrane protein A
MIRRAKTLLCAALLSAGTLGALPAAAAFSPCVIYTEAGKFDKSFNETAFAGVQRFTAETGVPVREFETTDAGQYLAQMRAAVDAACTDVVVIGFRFTKDMAAFAPDHPLVRFTIIDGVVEQPNVAAVLFAENEGSYLAGVAAGLSTRTGTVGFVGGMPVDVILRFQAGFAQGVRAVRPDAVVLADMVAEGPAGFADPFTGSELAREMMAKGADVVFPAAGSSGLGVLHAAAQAGGLALGVDSNQNYLYPGRILTSMVKRIDVAVVRAFEAGRNGTFQAGITVLGLKDGAVDVAVDDSNRPLWTPAIADAVAAARADIVAGRITVDGADAIVPR